MIWVHCFCWLVVEPRVYEGTWEGWGVAFRFIGLDTVVYGVEPLLSLF